LLILLRSTAVSSASSHDTLVVYRFIALDAQEGPARFLPLTKVGKVEVALEARLLHARGALPHTAIMYLTAYCHCAVSVDTLTGEFTQISDGREQIVGWVVDRKDTPLLREEWESKTHTYQLVVQHDDRESHWCCCARAILARPGHGRHCGRLGRGTSHRERPSSLSCLGPAARRLTNAAAGRGSRGGHYQSVH
jgi:hypothetical protein